MPHLYRLNPLTLDEWNRICQAVRLREEACLENAEAEEARRWADLARKIENCAEIIR